MWAIWLIAAGVFFIAEIATTGFLIFWLGLGALLAMVTSFITDSVFIQTIVFVISSTLLILLTKPLLKKITKKDKTVVTNAFSIVGKDAIVTTTIDPKQGIGQIKVDGETWSAKCSDDIVIEKGTEVKILAIDGVKAVVSISKKSSKKVEESV
mgnify:FL=1